jgi:hypothetical protein
LTRARLQGARGLFFGRANDQTGEKDLQGPSFFWNRFSAILEFRAGMIVGLARRGMLDAITDSVRRRRRRHYDNRLGIFGCHGRRGDCGLGFAFIAATRNHCAGERYRQTVFHFASLLLLFRRITRLAGVDVCR